LSDPDLPDRDSFVFVNHQFQTVVDAMRIALLACVVFCSTGVVRPQEAIDSTHIDSGRLALVGGVTLATGVAVHFYQQGAWWQGPRAPFRFENDWDYALNVDKLGHAYGAYLLSHLFGYSLRWSGLSRSSSVWYGSVLGLSYQLYVEVEDGFHKEYGFSPGDAISDVAGAMVPLLQESFPVLRSVSLKWSYEPSQEYINALKTEKRVFIDDYQGQYYWYSWTPRLALGDGVIDWCPRWLGVSVGIGARDLNNPDLRRHAYAITFDVNLSQIETGIGFVDALLVALNHIHVPSPGVTIERGVVKGGFIF
jgi:hypothetical protein